MQRKFKYNLRCRICSKVHDSNSISSHRICDKCSGNSERFKDASFSRLLESVNKMFSKWKFKGFEQRADDMVVK